MNIKSKNLKILSKLFGSDVGRVSKSYNLPFRIFTDRQVFNKSASVRNFSPSPAIDEVLKQIKTAALPFPSEISKNAKSDDELEIRNFLVGTSRTSFYCYLVNNQVIENIVKIILPEFCKIDCKIVEVNPGLGFLTNSLIKSGVQTVSIIEKYKDRSFIVNQLVKDFPIEVFINENLFTQKPWEQKKLFTMLFTSIHETQATHKIIGVLPSSLFYTTLLYQILNFQQIHNIHLCEFYFIISAYSYDKIYNFKRVRGLYSTFCLFHLFFEVEQLAEFPGNAIFPQCKNQTEKLYFVRLKGKTNIYDVISEKNFNYYLAFIKILGKSRFNLIIPTLEAFFPDCGIHLISKGITHMTQTYDLSFEDSINLFNICLNCSSFSSFADLCNEE